MDKRQDAQQRQGDKRHQADAGLQKCVILHLDGGDADAHQIDIQHHPLLELIEHQQHRAQVHPQHVAQPEIANRDHQQHRGDHRAKQHHGGGKRVTLRGHLPDPLQDVGVDAHAQQVQAQQRLRPGKRHEQQHRNGHAAQTRQRPVAPIAHLGVAAWAPGALVAFKHR